VTWPWYAQMSAMPGMWVQSAVCADVARCGSGMSGMWPRIEPIYLLTVLSELNDLISALLQTVDFRCFSVMITLAEW